jgi:hypothetical protein
MTVAELFRRMSSKEFTEWMAYSTLEPFGPLREDSRAAQAPMVVVNALRKKDSAAIGAEEFFPQLSPKYGENLALGDEDPDLEEVETEDGEIEVIRKPAPGTQLLFAMFPKRPAKKEDKK